VGLTSLVVWILLSVGCRAKDEPPGTKIEQTGAKLERYVEAYRAWAREHPGKECPDTLDELNRYIGVSDSLDAWGHPIKLQCGPTMPPGLKGIGMVSAGVDGTMGTDDDMAPF
jgi:hypothetical protein